MGNQNNKSQNIGSVILLTIFGCTVGFLASLLIPDDFGDATFYIIPILLLSVLGGYLAQFIVHEAGHLLFGLLTGYKFVSFRVGNLMLIKKNGQFRFANMNIPGTGGQCLMAPPEFNNGKFPYILYNSGGVILNIITSILASIAISDTNPSFFNIILVGFALGGILAAVTNGLPMVVGGNIPNDGYNIQTMHKDKQLKQAFWIQLATNDALTQGERPKNITVPNFTIKSPDHLTKPLITGVQLLLYNHYLDQLNFEKARTCLDELTPYMEEIVILYQNEIKLEKLFLEVIGENRTNVVNHLYDDSIVQYLQLTPNWLNHKRILMAYEWFHMNNQEKSLAYYQDLQTLAKKHPLEGEALMEMELTNWIKDQIGETD